MKQAKVYADKVEILEDGIVQIIFDPTMTDMMGTSPMVNFQAQVDKGDIVIIEHYSDPSYNKKYLKDLLAAKRYEVEVGGTMWNGHPADTDRFSQGKITAAFVLAINGQWPEGSVWKFNDGVSLPMSNADILSLTAAIQLHVQTAFNTEATKIDQIDNTGVCDINAGW